MNYRSAFTLFLSVGLILNCSLQGNANGKVFNLLLGLYKLNPLKGSPVFQSFSKHLLLGMGKDTKNGAVVNPKSSESVNALQKHLNEIEKMIHSKNKTPVNYVAEPAYDLDDVGAENFLTHLVVNNKVVSKEELKAKLDYNIINEDFSSLFEHIDGNDNNNENNVTKLLPVDNTILQNLPVDNQNEAEVELPKIKDKSGSHNEQLVEVRVTTTEESLINNLVEGFVEGLGEVPGVISI